MPYLPAGQPLTVTLATAPLKIPGLGNKLDDSWDGPYEVFRKLNDDNYEAIIPKCRGRRKVVHVNNLKPWVQ